MPTDDRRHAVAVRAAVRAEAEQATVVDISTGVIAGGLLLLFALLIVAAPDA